MNMKKLFLIMIAALCLVAVGCKKTCQCTQTETITYDIPLGDLEDPGFNLEPDVSTATYTEEAKNCSDLNAESNTNMMSMHMAVKVECK
jgi:hypothetical protein